MNAILYPPGNSHGACSGACTHIVCRIKRSLAEMPCSICNKPIGHDEPFEIDGTVDYVTHTTCAGAAAPTTSEIEELKTTHPPANDLAA